MIYFNFPISFLRNDINDQFFSDVMDYHLATLCKNIKLKEATSKMGLRFHSPKDCLIHGNELHEQHNGAMTGISRDMIFTFYKESRSGFDMDCLRAYLAIKSIIGSDSCKRVTIAYLVARMSGLQSTNEMKLVREDLKAYETSRHKFRKLKKELELSWYLIEYSGGTKGFWVSFKMTHLELARYVKKNKAISLDKWKAIQEMKKRAKQDDNKLPP